MTIPAAVLDDLAAAMDDHRATTPVWTPQEAAEFALAYLAGAGWAIVPAVAAEAGTS